MKHGRTVSSPEPFTLNVKWDPGDPKDQGAQKVG